MIRKAPISVVLLVFAAASAMADAGDPPARVARLNYQSGPVSFRPGGVDEWAAATLNYPLTTGDHLWTDPGARTEMHIGSTAIRMASQTALAFLNLDDRTVQLSLTEGSLDIRIRYLGEDETFEVDTPNAAVSLLAPGDYRIDTDSDSNITAVIVRAGEAEATGGGGTFPVHARESARLSGVDSGSQEMDAMPSPDEFDQWCEMRDRREERSESARYVGREMTGYEDLDQYGDWSEAPDYGWVWAPRTVVVGWAPYHYGHWAWVEPWGWTWVDDAPWGFAPFHYGRWAFMAGRWFWVPGRMIARPVYAPALVVFVGGPRFGVSGGVAAWFPLGPREVYRPAYHVSDVYVRQVNVTNVTNINIVNVNRVRYVNHGVPGAVMAVNTEAFVTARPVNRAAVAITDRDLRDAPVSGTAAPFAPRRESLLAGAVRGGPPARFAGREVVARTPPPPPPVPFAARRQALEANQGRPLDPAAMDSLRRSAPPRAPMVRTIVGGRDARPGGWRPAPGAAQPSPQPPRDFRPGRIQEQPSQPAAPPRDFRPGRIQEQPAQPAAPPRDVRPGRIQQPAQPAQPAEQPWNRRRAQEQTQPAAPPAGNRPGRIQEQPAPPPQRNADQPRRGVEQRNPEQRNDGGGRAAAPERPVERGQRRDGRNVEKREEKKDNR